MRLRLRAEGYVAAFFPGMTALQGWLVKVGTIVVITAVNLRGMESVGWLSLVLTVFIMLPFLSEPFFATQQIADNYR